MNHKRIKELLPLYIDDGLDEKEKEIIKRHIQECKECQQELKEYQENYDFLSGLAEEKAPSGFAASIMEKVGEEELIDEKERNNNDERIYKETKNKKSLLERLKGFISRPVRIPAGAAVIAAVILLLLITGIPGLLLMDNYYGGQFSKMDTSREGGTGDTEMEPNFNIQTDKTTPQKRSGVSQDKFYAAPMELNKTKESRMADSVKSEYSGENSIDLNGEINISIDRKIIKTANLTIEIKDIDKIDDMITNMMQNYNGYISNSNNWVNNNKQKYSWYQLRIPVNSFDQILSELDSGSYGQVLSRSISGQDVTEEYMDNEIRLKNLTAQEERYRELLKKATDVEDMLKIENELSRVRTNIERLEGRQNYLDNQVNFSTITVQFQQPQPISSGTPGIIKALKNALSTMVKQIYRIINLIGVLIPYILVIILLYLIFRAISHQRKK